MFLSACDIHVHAALWSTSKLESYSQRTTGNEQFKQFFFFLAEGAFPQMLSMLAAIKIQLAKNYRPKMASEAISESRILQLL